MAGMQPQALNLKPVLLLSNKKSYVVTMIVLKFSWILILLVLPVAQAHSQPSTDTFREFLKHRIGLSEEELAALNRGQVVVKPLGVEDKREVAVVGIFRIQASTETVLQAFHISTKYKNNSIVLESGSFSRHPVLDNLKGLTLEVQDIEDLKHCVIGKCNLKLSANMISRFQRQLPGNSSGYAKDTTRLFRKLLLDYVRSYVTQGDVALIEYHDQRRPISVHKEQEDLFRRMSYIEDFVPEFRRYFEEFPNSRLSHVESSIEWTKLKFSLKPTIVITHLSTYFPRENRTKQIVSIAKQIYADHYFDSSLTLTAVIGFPKNERSQDTYFLYIQCTRADALSGPLQKLRRGMVEDEIVKNLMQFLQHTRLDAEILEANR